MHTTSILCLLASFCILSVAALDRAEAQISLPNVNIPNVNIPDPLNALIKDNSITSEKIQDGTIQTNDLSAAARSSISPSGGFDFSVITRGPIDFLHVEGDQLVQAACLGNERVLGGGYRVNLTSSSEYQVLESFPSVDDNSWTIHVQSDFLDVKPLVQCGQIVNR
jgi:hypothetical protein